MISNSRKFEIKQSVLSVLNHAQIASVPVKIGSIIRSYANIKLFTYSSQIKKKKLTYDYLIEISETKDSFAVFCRSRNRYAIYYNDIDKNIRKSNRMYWNLAHELGHIILLHHHKCNKEKLFRRNIDDYTYNYLEYEADYFAQLLLVPHVVLAVFKIEKYTDIRTLCKISDQAANHRMIDFNIWKKHFDVDNITDRYDLAIFRFYYQFMFKRKCKNCNCEIVQRTGIYCIICGSSNTLQHGGDLKMIYPSLNTYDNGKLHECPKCHNELTNLEGNYCQICGTYLVNECTSCHLMLPSNARFCNMCGNHSIFFTSSILKPWDYNENNVSLPYEDEEFPFSPGTDIELPFQ